MVNIDHCAAEQKQQCLTSGKKDETSPPPTYELKGASLFTGCLEIVNDFESILV